MSQKEENTSLNFIEQMIEEDLKNGKHQSIQTRFPPEPNGFLHIGHAKAICLNFGLAKKYKGLCNLRFDDTNPAKEDTIYVESIKEDIRWLGFDWGEREYYASDYFEQLYEYALQLIRAGKAYVDELSTEKFNELKGTPSEPGPGSPFRDRPIEESLDLFERMKKGEFEEGKYVLRAKIDMTSPNMHLRDPAMYRIKNAKHHRTGDQWKIYPTYDFAHGQSDSLERVTHSLCTLEFEVHRPLYNWFIQNLEIFPSQQTEFSRLELNYTVTSKSKLLQLVEEKLVEGWDDPRMPTLSALRRRGYTPESIRNFVEKAGVTKRKSITDVSHLENSVREHLNKTAPRVMAVLDPVKVIITNYPEGQIEQVSTENNPEDAEAGTRELPFGREIYIERADFMENPPPPKKFYRLGPERKVRLKSAYIIECESYKKDEATGEITEIYCKYFPDSKSGEDTSGIKVKGTIHWVSVAQAYEAEVRLYDRLFNVEDPLGDKSRDFKEFINPNSLEIIRHAKLEPSLQNAKTGERFQFQRLGYFCVDSKYSQAGKPVFNRTVSLRDNWAKMQKKG